jgi:hypothetical protein
MGSKTSGKREPKRRKDQVTGLLGVIVATDLPARVIGTAQCGGLVIPAACPHCHARPPMWATSEWEGHCMCGEDFFRLRGEIRFGPTMQQEPVYAIPAGEADV